MSDPALWTIWSDFNKRYPGQTTFTPEKWQQIVPSWIDADFYGALELSHSATPEQIKKQYGMMAKKWHPDKQKDDASREAATLAFQRINESMQVLRDEKLRVAYDFVKQRTTKVPSRKRTAEECAANFMKQPASTGWATTGKGWTTWSDQQPPKRAKERSQPPSESRQYTAPPGPPPAAPPPKPRGTMPQHVPTPTRQVGPTGRAASTQAKTSAPSPSSKASSKPSQNSKPAQSPEQPKASQDSKPAESPKQPDEVFTLPLKKVAQLASICLENTVETVGETRKCKLCLKKFRDAEFACKHLLRGHTDLFHEVKQDMVKDDASLQNKLLSDAKEEQVRAVAAMTVALQEKNDALQGKRDMESKVVEMSSQKAGVEAELDKTLNEAQQLTREIERLRAQDALRNKHLSDANEEKVRAVAAKTLAIQEKMAAIQEKNAAELRVAALSAQTGELASDLDKSVQGKQELADEVSQLRCALDKAVSERQVMAGELEQLRQDAATTGQQRDAFWKGAQAHLELSVQQQAAMLEEAERKAWALDFQCESEREAKAAIEIMWHQMSEELQSEKASKQRLQESVEELKREVEALEARNQEAVNVVDAGCWAAPTMIESEEQAIPDMTEGSPRSFLQSKASAPLPWNGGKGDAWSNGKGLAWNDGKGGSWSTHQQYPEAGGWDSWKVGGKSAWSNRGKGAWKGGGSKGNGTFSKQLPHPKVAGYLASP